MPRPIKKKLAKQTGREEDVENILSRVRETAARRQRQIITYTAAVLAVVVLVAGYFMYQGSVERKVSRLQYEGFSQYYGPEEGAPLAEPSAPEPVRLQQALKSFEEAYKARKTPISLMYIANTKYAMGDYEGAAASLQEFIKEFPGEGRFLPMAYYKLGMARMNAGDGEGALKTFDTLYTLSPGPYKDLALLESARLLESMGRDDEAMTKYEAIVMDFPDSPFYAEASKKAQVGGEGTGVPGLEIPGGQEGVPQVIEIK